MRITLAVILLLSVYYLPSDVLADTPPNIVFIEVDDLNYVYTGPWGSKTAKTPTLDRLAREGFVFDHAMCQGVMCGPSRNSLICGKYPHQLGFYQNGDMRKLPRDSWLLPQAMKQAGYYTAWIGKSHLKPHFSGKNDGDTFQPFFGFDHELHTLGRGLVGDDSEGGDKGDNPYLQFLASKGLIEKFKADAEAKRPSTLADDEYLDGWFTHKAEQFIAEYRLSKPLFLWVNYSVPHDPHDVPQPYHAPFAKAAMPGQTKPVNFNHPESLIQRTKSFQNDKVAEAFQRGFHANIAFMDVQVQRLLESLERKKMLDRTWIVFFSDHGAMSGSHGLINKHTLFRSVTQPSLIVRAPGGVGGGKRIAQPVELLDLLPTCLEITRNKADRVPNGVSLLPLLRGQSIEKPYVFAEIEEWIAVSDGTHRLIRSADGETSLLFDEITDPENLTNIAPEKPQVVKRLGAALDEWLVRTGARLPPKSQ